MPCTYHLRALSPRSRRASAPPAARRWSSTRSRSPTASRWARRGMRTSLVSREVIADSIELVAKGHYFDGVVALSGCDKTIPGTVMALARLNLPERDALRRLDLARAPQRPRTITIMQVFEAIGAHAAGKITDEELERDRGGRLAGLRRLRRPVHRQHDGDGVRDARHLARCATPASPPSTTPSRTSPTDAGRAGHGRPRAAASARATSSRASRWRTRSPPSPSAAAPPTACCTCSPSPTRPASSSTSTTSTGSRPRRR